MSWAFTITTTNDYAYTVTTTNDWAYTVTEDTSGLQTKAGGYIITKAGEKIKTKQ